MPIDSITPRAVPTRSNVKAGMQTGWFKYVAATIVFVYPGCDSSSPTKPTKPNQQTANQIEDPLPKDQVDSQKPSAVSIERIRNVARAGRSEEAYRLAQSFLVAYPNNPEALVIAGECLAALGKRDDAISVFAMVPPEHSQFGVRALGQTADLQVAAEQPEDALATYRKLIKHHDEITLAHSRMAWILNSLGRRFEAAKHLRVLAERREINWRQLSGLVSVSDQNSVHPIPGTTGDENNLVAGDLRRARQLAMTRKWDECVALTNRLVEKFPGSAPIAAFAGTVYADRQDTHSLMKWRNRLPKNVADHPEYWSAIADWSALEGDFKGAARAAVESVTLDHTNYLMYLKLGQWLKAIGESSKSDKAVERSHQLMYARDTMRTFFTGKPSPTGFIQMAAHMIPLKRPNEAIGWAMQAQKTGVNPAMLKEIEKGLLQLQGEAQSLDDSNFRDWLLCGLNKEEFPLPKIHTDKPVANEDTETGNAPKVALSFENITQQIGSNFQYDPGFDRDDGSYFLHQMMGGGIGVIDFDLDGWQDVYFSQGGGSAFAADGKPNQLLRNLDGTASSDVTEFSGSDDRHDGRGVCVTDVNQDGFPDLIIGNVGPNICFQNNGDGTFRRREFAAWSNKHHWTSSVTAADVTGDGLPELIECNYIDDPNALKTRCTKTEQRCAPRQFLPSLNRLLTTSSDGRFDPMDDAMGIDKQPNYSLGVMITNIDGRAGNDIFVANDTLQNTLWVSHETADQSSQKYRLRETGRASGSATGPVGDFLGCMGIAVGDFDRDGSFDMHVTNYYNESSNLYLQKSAGLFVDNAAKYNLRGASTLMVGFGTHANDLDRDGFLDMVVLNGHAVDRRSKGEPLEMPPQVFRGSPGTFTSEELSDEFWSRATVGRTLAMVDWDRDGRVDFWANHLDQPSDLLKNTTKSGHWLRFSLVGTESERDATGARITVFCGDQTWVAWVTAGDGYYCNNESLIDIGIADAKSAEKVVVDWPSGQTDTFENLAADHVYLIVEGNERAFRHQ